MLYNYSYKFIKLIVKLYNKDKLSIGDSSKTVGKSKSVIHSILRKLEETGSCKAKEPPSSLKKTTAREDRWIGNESKKGRFAKATAICKRANANIGIEISRHAISQRLNEMNLNNRVASTKRYISETIKISRLKFATEHVKWSEEQWDCIHFSDVTGESTFDTVLRNDIRLRALKVALNFEEV